MRTVSDGTPPYISIMSRNDSLTVEPAGTVPDQTWVVKNERFGKERKGNVRNLQRRKKDRQAGDLFAGYQKTVQERVKNTTVMCEEEFEEDGECQV